MRVQTNGTAMNMLEDLIIATDESILSEIDIRADGSSCFFEAADMPAVTNEGAWLFVNKHGTEATFYVYQCILRHTRT